MPSDVHVLLDKWRRLSPRQWAEHDHGYVMPNDRPITFYPWQAALSDMLWAMRDQVQTVLASTVKDSGKTTWDSVELCYRWLTDPGIYYAVAHDEKQAVGRVFRNIARMVKRHPVLRGMVTATKTELIFDPTGSTIEALPTDASGHEGANFKGVSFTELGVFEHEAQVANFESLTPKRETKIRLIDSYAGITERSPIFEPLFTRMLRAGRVDSAWPITYDPETRTLALVMQGEVAQRRCFPGSAQARRRYYATQRATLRETTYRRYHLNEWTTAESSLFSPEMWERVVNPYLPVLPPDPYGPAVYTGMDIGIKDDWSALVGMYHAGGKACVAWVYVWEPEPGVPVSSEMVFLTLRDLARTYNLVKVNYDPSQALSIVERLDGAGVSCHEIPQTLPELGPRGNALYEAVRDGRLEAHDPDSDDPETARMGRLLRAAALSAMGREVSQGLHIKKAGAAKIDPIVAASFVIQEALGLVEEHGPPVTIRYA
jgi:phage terminase large subunit-like protein